MPFAQGRTALPGDAVRPLPRILGQPRPTRGVISRCRDPLNPVKTCCQAGARVVGTRLLLLPEEVLPALGQDAQMVRSVLPLLTLTLIAEDESYGYQLIERLANLGLNVTTGLVYPVLSRLERDGLVSSRMIASTNGPPRKYFALTTAGEAAQASAMDQWRLLNSATQESNREGFLQNMSNVEAAGPPRRSFRDRIQTDIYLTRLDWHRWSTGPCSWRSALAWLRPSTRTRPWKPRRVKSSTRRRHNPCQDGLEVFLRNC